MQIEPGLYQLRFKYIDAQDELVVDYTQLDFNDYSELMEEIQSYREYFENKGYKGVDITYKYVVDYTFEY